jgi:hypothetical protein
MSDQPTQYPRIYGFARRRNAFSWHQPPDDSRPASSDSESDPAKAPALDIVQETKELADANPRVAREVIRLLTEESERLSANAATSNDASSIAAPNKVPSKVPSEPQASRGADATSIAPSQPEPSRSTATNALARTEAFAGGEPERARTKALASGGVERTRTNQTRSTPASTKRLPADAVGPTSDLPVAPAITEVRSPTANSRSSTSGNSQAPQKSASPGRKSRARNTAKKAEPLAPPQLAKRLSGLEVHQIRCSICGHALQADIDARFVNWDPISHIAHDYNVNRSVLYRHANATGLFETRACNIRRALGHIIDTASRVETTADSVVRAVKVFAHINARGEWFNPPTQVHYSFGPRLSARRSRPQQNRKRKPRSTAKSGRTPSHLNKRLKH